MSCVGNKQACEGQMGRSAPMNYAQLEERMIGIEIDDLAVKIQPLAL